MNQSILKGKWEQLKGEAKLKWQRLSDEDLDKIAGEYEKLEGVLHEKYGYAKEKIAEEIQTFQEDWQKKDKKHPQ